MSMFSSTSSSSDAYPNNRDIYLIPRKSLEFWKCAPGEFPKIWGILGTLGKSKGNFLEDFSMKIFRVLGKSWENFFERFWKFSRGILERFLYENFPFLENLKNVPEPALTYYLYGKITKHFLSSTSNRAN